VRRIGPLMLGGAVACSAAAAGLTNAVDEPTFEMLLHMMIVAGFATSLLGRVLGVRVSFIGVGVIGGAVAATAYRGAPVPLLSLGFPPEVVADEDLTWATLWAWLMVGLCFMQGRRRNILFCLVAGLAVLGLTATVNLNTAMMVYFGIFLFATIFVWGYEHLLNLGEEAALVGGGADDNLAWPGIARTQALAGTTLMAAVMVAALVLGGLVYAAVPRLYLSPSGFSRYARWMRVSLLSYGGMINSLYVGRGPVNLAGTEAIIVKSKKPALWRGQAYDRYTGGGWTKELSGMRDLIPAEDGWFALPGTERVRGETLHQEVTLIGMESRAFFAATQPVKLRVRTQRTGGRSLRYHAQSDPYGAMLSRFMMTGGVEYEVISKLPPTDPATLRACPARYSAEMRERYIKQVPPQAQVGLAELVKELTRETRTPYDKVVALREYLEKTCVYSERAPAIPPGRDAAAYFVTKSRKGACGLFATALAVMCRLAGVPARVVTGFHTGAWDPDRGAYVALHKDAHAWTEVYFPGVGWVPFDAAAARTDEGGKWMAYLGSREFMRRLRGAAEYGGRLAIILITIAALFSAVLGPGILLRWLRRRFRVRDARERLGETYEWFRRKAARLGGFRPQRWQTPEEMRETLVASGLAGAAEVRGELDNFTAAFYATRYGPREPGEQHVRRMATLARRVLRAMRRAGHSNSTARGINAESVENGNDNTG